MFLSLKEEKKKKSSLNPHTHPENMIPDRGASKVYVEICVAVFDPHKAVLLDKGFREEGVVWPVVLNPGQCLSHVRNLHQLCHPAGDQNHAAH